MPKGNTGRWAAAGASCPAFWAARPSRWRSDVRRSPAWRYLDSATVTLERLVVEENSGPVRLSPLIVAGARVERTIGETASSVAVVTADDLEDRPAVRAR